MTIIDRLKRRIKHTFCDFFVLYADGTELLIKTQYFLKPLPQGCELVKITCENKKQYKSKHNIEQMLQVEGDAWAVVNNNKIIAYQFGTYHGNNSPFFKVKNCDYEHSEILVDEEFRRKGVANFLLYNAIKSLNENNKEKLKIGTVIRPNNIPSLKMHMRLGFKISHRVKFIHLIRKKSGHYSYINIPHHSI